MTRGAGEPAPAHSEEVVTAYERMLGSSPARRRSVDLRSGRRVHIIEVGEGPPLVLLHGSSTSSLSLVPLLERLEGVRAIAVDRPGFGLSEPVHVPRERFREAAIAFVDEIVAALGLDTYALGGNSMGGTWALWHALARPDRVERLVLIGSAPLLPGTRPPAPLRVMATPVVGDVLTRVAKPNARMLVRLLASVGEGDTIVRYPDLIEALAAVGRDPVTSAANLAELRAGITPFGFRRSLRMRPDELRRLAVPVLVLWGDHDPVGAVEVARETARLLPAARLEVLPAGHVPYLGNPEQASELLSSFVRSES
jgi:pimeloyl-ACP methyl ester carboxylesterase